MITPEQLEAHFATWTPTSENINALPGPVREFVMRLHANTDPAGELQRAMVWEMRAKALEKMIAEAQWQPIETAPEYEVILVWHAEYIPLTAYRESGGWLTIGRRKIDEPTHWMPLPEPPETEADDGRG